MQSCGHSLVEPLESRALLTAALTLFDAGGFEAPRYAPGPLEGQDAAGPWLKDTARVGVAQVQAAAVASGAQAVRMTRPAALNGDTRYGVFRPFTPDSNVDVLRVAWDMNVSPNAQPGVPFGPFFGVEVYSGPGPLPLLVGSLGVDATTGDVLYQHGTSGALAETGSRVSLGVWNHFLIEVDYVADTYTVFVNGAARATTSFVADAATGFTDAPLAALAASRDTVATATGTAFFDNYLVEAHADPTPPVVTAAYVAGSAWTATFKQLVGKLGLGDATHGYALRGDAGQLRVLPWNNLDRVSLTFNRDVAIDEDDLTVRGVNVAFYDVAAFAYDRSTRTATWRLARPIGNDKVVLELDAAGVAARNTQPAALDGEWVTGADAFPSGDGSAGGDFRYRFNVLPGDVTRSGRVDAADALAVRLRQRLHRRAVRNPRDRVGYTIFHDPNGDTRINVLDVAAVRREMLTTLPAGEPAVLREDEREPGLLE